MTALDKAHARMIAAGETEAARRGFFAVLAGTELFVVLEAEPGPGSVRPVILPTEAGEIALAFDTEARMAAFMGRETDYVALSGRRLAAMLAPARLGLGLNLDAPSEVILPAEAMGWIVESGSVGASTRKSRITGFTTARDLPEGLIGVLDRALAGLAGHARAAYLARAAHDDGQAATLLLLTDVPEPAEAACASALAEALSLAGFGADALDIGFAAGTDTLTTRMAPVALRFDIPAPAHAHAPRAPGMDPAKPPKLR